MNACTTTTHFAPGTRVTLTPAFLRVKHEWESESGTFLYTTPEGLAFVRWDDGSMSLVSFASIMRDEP